MFDYLQLLISYWHSDIIYTMSTVEQFESDKVLTRTLFNNFGTLLVFTFYSDSNKASLEFKDNFKETIPLFGDYPNVKYFFISQERCPETFKKYSIVNTPTTIFTQTDKKVIKSFENEQIGNVFDSLSLEQAEQQNKFQKDKLIWHPKIKSILEESQVIIFIKGTVDNPKCGFTQTLISLLKDNQVSFTFYDIIEDQYMRYWLRNYCAWPTYPQIHAAGKLIGGLDVFKAIIEKGQLQKVIPRNSRSLDHEERFNLLIKQYQNLILIDKFSYQDQNIQNFILKVKQSEGQRPIRVYNIALDQKMSLIAKNRYGTGFPIYLVKGQKKEL